MLSLSQCSPPEGTASTNSSSQVNQASYQRGVQKGKLDGASGLSRTPNRHAADYSEADRDDFFRGYEDGYKRGIHSGPRIMPPTSSQYGQPLKAVKSQGQVAIVEGKRTIAICRTALPNIETTRFISEQEQIVIKSRGAHGPAEVQLFNSRNGAVLGQVKAYELSNGGPTWAAGMAD
ncbi:hypothetical protein HW115_04370 [Verrucomicrobiaceae bacterium N1E253]|uniref:Uncharacterized protein n=2 Tax=Oceaniferula marina TaxID=2748318 RepID=A0A851GJH8_9BACT|nr:hypothetical protein [Oceaniferula marina]